MKKLNNFCVVKINGLYVIYNRKNIIDENVAFSDDSFDKCEKWILENTVSIFKTANGEYGYTATKNIVTETIVYQDIEADFASIIEKLKQRDIDEKWIQSKNNLSSTEWNSFRTRFEEMNITITELDLLNKCLDEIVENRKTPLGKASEKSKDKDSFIEGVHWLCKQLKLNYRDTRLKVLGIREE